MSTLVTKNVQVGTSATASQNFLLYQPSTPDGTARIAYGTSGSQTDVLTVNNVGNLGLGTTSPNFFGSGTKGITVNGSSGSHLEMLSNGASLGFLLANNNGLQLQTNSNNPLIFSTNNTERARIDSSGDFLLGTTSAPANGAGTRNVVFNNSGNLSTYVKLSNGTTGSTANDGFDLIMGTSSDAYIYNRENGPINFGTNNTERARIDSSGNLLVGWTSNTYLGSTDFRFLTYKAAGASIGVTGGGYTTASYGQLYLSGGYGDGGTRTSGFFIRSQASGGGGNVINDLLFVAQTGNGTSETERARIDSAGVLSVGNIKTNQIYVDIMAMWRTADIQGYKTDYSDGGSIVYSWDNGTVRMDSSVGSHNWDIGTIYLPAGTYQLVIQYRPSPTQHGWNVYGTNSNAHVVRLQSDAGYGSFTTYIDVGAPPINKDLGYSITYTSGVYTVASSGTFRIGMQTDPYSGGGYKYYIEAAYVIRLR